MTVSGVLYL